MKNINRSQQRYLNRHQKREHKTQIRNEELKSFDEIFTYENLYLAGIQCQVHVTWKRTTQKFRQEQVLRTYENYMRVRDLDNYTNLSNLKFKICERGKTRDICAPQIDDRQIHKVICNQVYPIIYQPRMIDNNPASLKGKGLAYFQKKFKQDIRYYLQKHGKQGYIITIDLHNFFGSAQHDIIKRYHEKYILDPKLRKLVDKITEPEDGQVGQNIGYEPSQFEMIFYTTPLDNYMTCQDHLKGYGHYMDDFYMIVPPGQDPNKILDTFITQASKLGLTLNEKKTQIIPFGKPFRICKAKYIITDTNEIVVKGSRDTIKRARHKIKAAQTRIPEGKMNYVDLYNIVNNAIAYFNQYDDHTIVLKIRRLVYSMYGIQNPDSIIEYRQLDSKLAGT